ncbi:MAG TPA: sodium:solute symporter family protein [Vicinamibacterales bacterium]|nr:sodium:solute symporter family protein [Vicinamibacterales bacterium]
MNGRRCYHRPTGPMRYLVVIVVYSLAQIALGLWISRRVKGSSDFFVAGRRLGPGLLFATFLAANIGGGSTIGATGLGYRDGLAAWWWVGSAGFGSIVLALWIGPRIRRIAAEHDLRTLGDFLEWRYDSRVRAIVAALLWVGTIAILAGQLIGIAWILTVVIGTPKIVGCAIGAVVVTVYFGAGGLMSSAVVNVVQLTVKVVGFLIALPIVLAAVGGVGALHTALPDPAMWNPWQHGASGWVYLAMLAPNFMVSPGLLQKAYGARDDRAVRIGIGLNGAGLLLYAIVPTLLGMAARGLHPALDNRELALPMIFMHDVPFWVGALGLAAVFSAEVSAADAVLFMLATSLSQDLYKRFIRPDAADRQVLVVARLASVAGGTLAVLVAFVSQTIVDALSIFYTMIAVSLFVPVIAGLYLRRPRPIDALAAIAGGVVIVAVQQFGLGGAPIGIFTPAMAGLVAAALAFAAAAAVAGQRAEGRGHAKPV